MMRGGRGGYNSRGTGRGGGGGGNNYHHHSSYNYGNRMHSSGRPGRYDNQYGGNSSHRYHHNSTYNNGSGTSTGRYDTRNDRFNNSGGGSHNRHDSMQKRNYRDTSRDRSIDKKRSRPDDYHRRTNSVGRGNRTPPPPPPPNITTASSNYRGGANSSGGSYRSGGGTTRHDRGIDSSPRHRSPMGPPKGPVRTRYIPRGTRGMGSSTRGTMRPNMRGGGSAGSTTVRNIIRRDTDLRIMRRKLLYAQQKDRARVLKIARLTSSLRRRRIGRHSQSPTRRSRSDKKDGDSSNDDDDDDDDDDDEEEEEDDNNNGENDEEAEENDNSDTGEPAHKKIKSSTKRSAAATRPKSSEKDDVDDDEDDDDGGGEHSARYGDDDDVAENARNDEDNVTTGGTSDTAGGKAPKKLKDKGEESSGDIDNDADDGNEGAKASKGDADGNDDGDGAANTETISKEQSASAASKKDGKGKEKKEEAVEGEGKKKKSSSSKKSKKDDQHDSSKKKKKKRSTASSDDESVKRDKRHMSSRHDELNYRRGGSHFIKLTCVHCHMKCVTFKEYSQHLYSRTHKIAIRQIALRQRTHLSRLRARQRTAQREIEDKSKEEYESKFCHLCCLHYRQPKAKHQLSEHHKIIKKFLMPYCSTCYLAFKSPMLYETHRCSLEHIRNKARKNDSDTDNSGDETISHIDLNKFMTVDSVGEIDEDEADGADDDMHVDALLNTTETSEENPGNAGDDDAVDIGKQRSLIGSQYVKKVDAFYCDLCGIHATATESLDAFLKQHCKTRTHLKAFLRQKRLEREDIAKDGDNAEVYEKNENWDDDDEEVERHNKKKSAGVDSVAAEGVEAEGEDIHEHVDETYDEDQEDGPKNGDDGDTNEEDLSADKLWEDVDRDLGEFLSDVNGGDHDEDEEDESVLNIDIESEKPKSKEINGKKDEIKSSVAAAIATTNSTGTSSTTSAASSTATQSTTTPVTPVKSTPVDKFEKKTPTATATSNTPKTATAKGTPASSVRPKLQRKSAVASRVSTTDAKDKATATK